MLVRRMTALAIIVVACCAGASRIALADTVDDLITKARQADQDRQVA